MARRSKSGRFLFFRFLFFLVVSTAWILAGFGGNRGSVFYAEGTDNVDDGPRIAQMIRGLGYSVDFRWAKEVPTALSSDPKSLSKYKVVILSDVPADSLSSKQTAALEKYVQNGGGLLVVGGAKSLGMAGWQFSELATILPVIVEPGMEQGEVRVRVVQPGDPIARAVPWSETPALSGYNPVKVKDPQYVVAADANSGTPLLAVRQWGKGHVAVFSSDITALWGEEFNRWGYFPVFMSAVLADLGKPAGMTPGEAATAGAAAGAALPAVLGWLGAGLGALEGWAEKRRLWRVARASHFIRKGLEEGARYGRSLRLEERAINAWGKIARRIGIAEKVAGWAGVVADAAGAYSELPAEGLPKERWARTLSRGVRAFVTMTAGVVAGSVIATIVPGDPVIKALVGAGAGWRAEKVAERLYDATVGRYAEVVMLRYLEGA